MELKYIWLDIESRLVEAEAVEEFVRTMQKDNIVVIACNSKAEPKQMSKHLFKYMSETLIITDCMPEKFPDNSFVVGYGLDYKGGVKHIVDSLSDISASYLRLVYARCIGKPFVVAETDRLVIREMSLSDLPEMYRLYETLKDCLYIEPLYEWDEEYAFCEKYIENMYTFFGYGLWLVFEKESGELVGRAGIENREIDGELCRELGYLIRGDKQGRGYAKETAEAIIAYAKDELCLEEMFICTHKNNKPSISLAEKLGFTLYAADIDGMNLYRRAL